MSPCSWRYRMSGVVLAAAVMATIVTLPAQADPDGCRLPTGSSIGYAANLVDRTISVIDLTDNEVVDEIAGFRLPWNVELSPDRRLLFVDDAPIQRPDQDVVLVLDTCTGDVVRKIPTLGVGFSTISPDRKFVFATNIAATGIQQIDTSTGKVVDTFLTVPLSQGALTADHRTLWVISIPGLLYSIDMKTKQIVGAPIFAGIAPAQFAISPDGRTVAVADLAGTIVIVDTATRSVRQRLDLGFTSYPSFAAVTPDNSQLWVGGYSGAVAVIDMATSKVVKRLDTNGWVAGVSFTADSKRAYVSTTPGGSVIADLGIVYLVPVLFSLWKPGGEIRVIDLDGHRKVDVIKTGNVPMKLTLL